MHDPMHSGGTTNSQSPNVFVLTWQKPPLVPDRPCWEGPEPDWSGPRRLKNTSRRSLSQAASPQTGALRSKKRKQDEDKRAAIIRVSRHVYMVRSWPCR